MKTVGIGTRVLNFLIDTGCIFILSYIAFKTWNWYLFFYEFSTSYNFGWFFFATLFIFYCFFEAIFNRTPGKWFTLSKVISINGEKPSFAQIIIRSFLRIIIIDAFFVPFYNKPLHDLLTKTEIIEVE